MAQADVEAEEPLRPAYSNLHALGARPAASLGAAVTGSRMRRRVGAICAPRDKRLAAAFGVEPPAAELGLGEGVVISHRRPGRSSETTALSG